MSDKIGLHCFVHGRVQGVWFRASTKSKAESLGLTGWARNLEDGRVEVMAYGDKASIMQLHEWLKEGPPLAKVLELTIEERPWEEYKGFDTF